MKYVWVLYLKMKKMKVKINVYVRKSDYWKNPGKDDYDIREEYIEGDNEQDIIDKFYIKNRRCDAGFFHRFADEEWKQKLSNWLNSEDYQKRSFSLYYSNSIVD